MPTRQVLINVPEKVHLAEKTDKDAFAQELSMLAAVKLYELERLSYGLAAKLAGMPRIPFLLNLKRYKVFPLEAELRELENVHAWNHQQHLASTLFVSYWHSGLASRAW